MGLTNEEINRYSRHIRLPEVGMEGQQTLKSSKALIVGAGGLGCPIGLYLGAAGVGTIGIIDFDTVDRSNLHRQIAYTVDDISKPKVEQLKRTILASNPNINVVTYNEGISTDNALSLFSEYDIIVDGSDNFNTRYLVNDAAYFTKKPLVYGSIFRFQGQMTVFNPHHEGPCYRCLYASPPPVELVPNCAEGGVLGVLPGTVGLIQATEAIKLLLGTGESLAGRLLLYDALKMSFKTLKARKDPGCALCGENASITEFVDYDVFCNVSLPGDAEAFNDADYEVTVQELAKRLKSQESLHLVDVREQNEWNICRIEGAELYPLSEFEQHISKLSKDEPIYLYCYGGVRSMKALKQLHAEGFTNIRSVAGGISNWAKEIDPSMPQY